jgi:hypothetical protein
MAKAKNSKKKNTPLIEPVALPQEKLAWQGALKLLRNRVFKIRSPRGHGTGFHIGNFGTDGRLCAVATAYHVLQMAHDWGESIKLVHAETEKEILLRENDRAILTYVNKDLAVILFTLPADLILPTTPIELIPQGAYLVPGVDIAWCGFPAVKNDKLCFFHGFISCYLDHQSDYLIDGVAIHGVSGGPAFYVDIQSNTPKIAGVVTQYIANRTTGESLPGVSMITSIAPCEETIKNLNNLNQAKKEADEQKASPANEQNPNSNPETPR